MSPLSIVNAFDALTCLGAKHRPGLLVLALLVCMLTSTATVVLLRQVRTIEKAHRWHWCVVAGIALGYGAWATHFIALIAYDSGFAAGFSLLPTVGSFLIAYVAGQLAAVTAGLTGRRAPRLFATGLLTAGLAGMHYLGMHALSIPAIFSWNSWLVATSLTLPAILLHQGMKVALDGRAWGSVLRASLWLSGGIAVLHFTAMAALTVYPSRLSPAWFVFETHHLAEIIGLLSLGVFGLTVTTQVLRRQAQRVAIEKDRVFSMLLKGASGHAICMLDRDGRVSQWNAGGSSLLGYDAEDIVGTHFEVLFTPEEQAQGAPARALEMAEATGATSAVRQARRKDGSLFWAHGTLESTFDEKGRHLGYSLIVKDVTEWKDARDLVEQTSARLDTALENMHEGLCLFDRQERLVLCNRRFRELWHLDETATRPGTALGALVVAGFMNPRGTPDAARQLWTFRQILEETLGEERHAPICADFGDTGVFSIANNALPDGGWVTTCTDITEQRRSEAQIQHMALHDALTGLPNRTQFYLRVDHKIELSKTEGCKIAVVAIDLDRFKEINDVYGHAAGDRLLQVIAKRLSEALHDDEIIARLGGDEFAAAKRYHDQAEVDAFLARIQHCIVEPVTNGEQSLGVGGSLGIAMYPQDGDTREALLNHADLAMYRAKASPAGSICYFEPGMDETARARRQIANDLRQAAAKGEFSLLYQPQRSLKTGALAGYEALLRWKHPTRGMIPPDEFIPIAEETGEIIPIGEWVLRQACEEARRWPTDQKVAVNLSPVQFLQPTLVDTVRAILLDTGLSPRQLELEITETAIITDKLRALHCLRQIKAMGVSVAIDDFGTGYSSLDTLHSFPFDKIKIDKSFLLKADTSGQARAIIRAVLALGRSLEIPVLAEGVENEAQLKVLQTEGCDEAQGYYFGRPADAPSTESARVASA